MTTGRINQVTTHTTGEGSAPATRHPPALLRQWQPTSRVQDAGATPRTLRRWREHHAAVRSIGLPRGKPTSGRPVVATEPSLDGRLRQPAPTAAPACGTSSTGPTPTDNSSRTAPASTPRPGQQRAVDTETPRGSGSEARHSSSAALSPPCKGGAAGRCNRAYDGHGQPDLSRQSSNSPTHGGAASQLPTGSRHHTRPGNRGRARRKVRRTSPPPLSQGSLDLPDRRGEPSVGMPPSNRPRVPTVGRHRTGRG